MEPIIRSHVRDSLRRGMSPGEAIAFAAAQFPTAAVSQIQVIATQESRRTASVEGINKANRGQFANIAALAGCGDRNATVRARIVVHYRDRVSGLQSSFGHTVFMTGSGRLGNILDRAISDVIREARSRGYDVPSVTSGMKSGDTRYELAYVECE